MASKRTTHPRMPLPWWLMYADLNNAEFRVYAAIYSALRPTWDGTFQRRGYCCIPQIQDMTGLGLRRTKRVIKTLREKGLLRAEKSTDHLDGRLIWTVPYFEVDEYHTTRLSQKGWYDVVTEVDEYTSMVRESVPNLPLPCGVEETGMPTLPSYGAMGMWRKLYRTVAGLLKSTRVGDRRKHTIDELIYKAVFAAIALKSDGVTIKSSVGFLVDICKGLLGNTPHHLGKYSEYINNLAAANADLGDDVDEDGDDVTRLHDLLIPTTSPAEPLPECVYLPKPTLTIVDSSYDDGGDYNDSYDDVFDLEEAWG